MAISSHEFTLSVDKFKQPQVLTEHSAISQLLVHLILLEPGTFQDHPEMGVGLVSRYRYKDKNSLSDLQNRISEQIATYLPDLGTVEVGVSINDNNELVIDTRADNVIYRFETSIDNGTLSLSQLT